MERVALRERANREPGFLEKNSLGQVPVLELDDGAHLSESVSICRHLEELHPKPALFGATPKERAWVDMWIRRIESQLAAPIGQIWRHTHPVTAALRTQYKDFGESNRAVADQAFRWLDKELEGRRYVAGDTFSMADIVTFTTVEFGQYIDATIPSDCLQVRTWHARVSARPSAMA